MKACHCLRSRVLLAAAVLLLLLPLLSRPARGAEPESILNFVSRITVQADGRVSVTEAITVRATGATIKRGIVRDFPTTYKDRAGSTVKVGFRVTEVRRDGREEPYKVKDAANGKKIYIGSPEVLLRPGIYTYSISYETDRQIGFFKDFDELYWNVTGTGWTFPIEQAEAVVTLPPGAQVVQQSAYTGPYGARGKDYRTWEQGRGRIVFRTTRGLAPQEGLTIAVAWPKGLVPEPGWQTRIGYFLEDNAGAVWALLGISLLLAYYLIVWVRVGRDPARGVIVPLYEPPQNLEPAAVRVLMRLGYDDKALTATLINLAVKGFLVIEDTAGEPVLVKTGNPQVWLTDTEARVAARLFGSRQSLTLKNENHAAVNQAKEELQKRLRAALEKVYFFTNSGYLAGGGVIGLASLGALVWGLGDTDRMLLGGFLMIWLAGWSAGCLAIWRSTGCGWRLLLFGFFEIVALMVLAVVVSGFVALAFLVIIGLNLVFFHLIKAPTKAGRRLMDQVEGFKMYLARAEQDRLDRLHPPEMTPERYEKYLPYALALDVENEWSEQFAGVLARAGQTPQEYTPGWYHGRHWDSSRPSRLARDLGSGLTGAIASSSMAPGSSSGSGGGGFSGGGGGGGGGSGW